MKILGKYPLFLLLLPIFILLHIEKDYSELLDYSAVHKEILIICLAPLVIYGLSWLMFRSAGKANLFAFIAVFFFYFLGDVKDALMHTLPHSFLQSYTFLLPLAIVILVIAGLLIRKSNRSFQRLFRFIHLALILFIVLDAAVVLWPSGVQEKEALNLKANFKPCKDCPTPDIYYIILDEYTSTPFLKKEFNFDNSSIEEFLTNKGFQVIHNSNSNYNLTAFSMGSTFSLNYLYSIDTAQSYFLRNYLTGIRIMYESPLFSMLQRQGYKVYNHSIFHVADHPSTIPSKDLWRTTMLYQQYNILKKMDNEIGWQFPPWLHIKLGEPSTSLADRGMHDSIALSKLFAAVHEKTSQPKFVYTHLLIPHDHYALDSAGNRIPPKNNNSLAATKASYLLQLVNANKAMRKMVDSIQLSNPTPPIIIIQGDHGFRSGDYLYKNDEFDNFNAVFFPGQLKIPVPDSLTNVNTFRYVFNHLFRTDYPMLENKKIFLKYKPL